MPALNSSARRHPSLPASLLDPRGGAQLKSKGLRPHELSLGRTDGFRTPDRAAPSTKQARTAELPETTEALVAWMDRELPPCVHVTARAVKSLRKAGDVDARRIAMGLLFLRDFYAPSRVGGRTHDEKVQTALAESGFIESATFSKPSQIKGYPEYSVQWNGRTVWMDRHLKRGTKSPIRIYFFYCRETATVVVGHLPGHLSATWG